MSWDEIALYLIDLNKKLDLAQGLPEPEAATYSMRQMIEREFQFEELWRARLDRAALRCLESGETPESPDECYFVSCRLMSGIEMAVIYARTEESWQFGLGMDDQEKLRWLLIDGWSACGVALYKVRREAFLNGMMLGFFGATGNPKLTAENVVYEKDTKAR